jgi:hypothetical protein
MLNHWHRSKRSLNRVIMSHIMKAAARMRHFVAGLAGKATQSDFQFLSIDSLEISPTLCSRS